MARQDRAFEACDHCRPEIQRLGDVANTQREIRQDWYRRAQAAETRMRRAGAKRRAYIAEMLEQMAHLQSENKRLRAAIEAHRDRSMQEYGPDEVDEWDWTLWRSLNTAASRPIDDPEAAVPADVTEFGAVGDGVTDDTAAFQAAIDSVGSDHDD